MASQETFSTLLQHINWWYVCRILKDCHLLIEEDFDLNMSVPFFAPDYVMPTNELGTKVDEELPDYEGGDQAFNSYLDYDWLRLKNSCIGCRVLVFVLRDLLIFWTSTNFDHHFQMEIWLAHCDPDVW